MCAFLGHWYGVGSGRKSCVVNVSLVCAIPPREGWDFRICRCKLK